jgi:hypothetical protein
MSRRLVPASACLLALGLAGCASSTSTAGFSGERHAAAQTVANLQSHATNAEDAKICKEDLAAGVVSRLGGARRCEAAIKSQLTEVDVPEVTIESIALGKRGTSATARVKSTYEGKKRITSVYLVKEGGKWRISAL